MSKVKIETITDVHIGSGETLSLNNDYCLAKDSEGYPVVGIIDPRKVLNLIGIEHIDTWLLGIENKRPIADIVHQYAPSATVEDYTTRTIEKFCNNEPQTLKEYIHDGLGRPYIPGSSIKGAIRTAVLASLVSTLPPENIMVDNGKGKVSASIMEKKFFGHDPNSDIFRFLHVGDAIFGRVKTSAITMANINERERHSFWDASKSQNIEVLSMEDETTFEMRLKLDCYKKCRMAVGELPQCMTSLSLLFETINAHTQSLLEDEMDYWTKVKDVDKTDKVSAYIDECEFVLSETKQCSHGKSCILRIGHGCGWRFITGAWSERSPKFYDKVVENARPTPWKYRDYDFPKSRRVAEDSEDDKRIGLLGFVKLSILSD